MALLIACRDCAAIQQLPPPPKKGRLECRQCGRTLEATTGRSLDGALACSFTTLLLLFPANFGSLMTLYIPGIPLSSHLYQGIVIFWRQGLPLAALVLALLGIVLPFVHFALLTVTLAAIRCGVRDKWVGIAFRYAEKLDVWAMADVLLIGAGIGYGRVASQARVHIDIGGWCLVAAAFMTMLTRASLERRAVWRRLEMPAAEATSASVSCTSCDLVLPPAWVGARCPRCAARIHRRHPFSVIQCAALTLATWVLMPIAYSYPMSTFWKLDTPMTNNIINGIEALFQHDFWYFGIVIFCVSVIFPFTKVLGLTWFLLSIRFGWTEHLRFKTGLFRFVDEVGRWSVLDPFTVLIFTPMIQLGQIGHFDARGGTEAFLATVVLSMVAARVFDPRLMWDVAARQTVKPETASPLAVAA